LKKKEVGMLENTLDLDLIKKGAKKLIGTNDYSTFRASSCHAKSPIKTIKSIKLNHLKIKLK
jgi:tRNA pseudouridine38-40 synthase